MGNPSLRLSKVLGLFVQKIFFDLARSFSKRFLKYSFIVHGNKSSAMKLDYLNKGQYRYDSCFMEFHLII